MFVSLDKITIPVAEEFNVRTGKAQEITSHHITGSSVRNMSDK